MVPHLSYLSVISLFKCVTSLNSITSTLLFVIFLISLKEYTDRFPIQETTLMNISYVYYSRNLSKSCLDILTSSL